MYVLEVLLCQNFNRVMIFKKYLVTTHIVFISKIFQVLDTKKNCIVYNLKLEKIHSLQIDKLYERIED